MPDTSAPSGCTLGELMIYQLAQTVEDGILVFHGFGSPLVQIALHLAKRTHAPHTVLVAGATYGVNPKPLFITPTSNDWALSSEAECSLDIGELFDLAASGRMGRMFLSGLQIDRWGNLNVTRLERDGRMTLKLPGGGGGCNLSCDANRITLWTAAHRAASDDRGRRRYRLVKQCDFVTSVGHRTAEGLPRSAMPYRGQGPDRLITELGIFDFNSEGHARLTALYPDTDVEVLIDNTEFDFPIADGLGVAKLPDADSVEFIRRLDPLKVHQRELSPADRQRTFPLSGV
ncbi:CoA-transferase subunit beta [Methylosarcina fibrata]|uniref:CoA-transferase subunit beta n=1 Tax=Methylosarcina fibrata TaxID=105972 RepID=UPI0003720602|nr:CoA-transferase [Methylosarcina fibrata]